MEKSNLYTGGGDKGITSLADGTRVTKDHVRLHCYGTVDELNSWIGLLVAEGKAPLAVEAQLRAIQHKLFNIGAYLATQCAPAERPEPYGLDSEDCTGLEEGIDALDAEVPKIKTFILPGGTPQSARAHIARTVCRRAERHLVTLATHDKEWVSPVLLRYMNRLSDYLFILARAYNHWQGQEDEVWRNE